jgi:AraC family transcriptional regulator
VIARAAGLSEFHFARAFKAAVGSTPHRYLNERRLLRAQALLRTTDLKLSEVAMAAGFGSQSHLTTAMREFCGVTPKRYRELAG